MCCMKKSVFVSLFLLALCSGLTHSSASAIHGSSAEIEKPFVHVTVYPTASLSRYDYTNDVDLYEIRVYVDLRQGSPVGPVIKAAQILADERSLALEGDLYTVRIPVDRNALPNALNLTIMPSGEEGLALTNKISLPSWLIINHPRPQLIDAGQDLTVSWTFSPDGGPVDLHAYDFKNGSPRFDLEEVSAREAQLPGITITPDTVIRIFVTPTWMFKRYIRSRDVYRGSEINVIPWSQVFLRSRDVPDQP